MKEFTIKQLRLPTRLSQREFAEKFNIPFKTLQNWEYKRNPPVYITQMIYTILQMEERLKQFYPNRQCMACDPEDMCSIENATCSIYTCMNANYAVLCDLEEDYQALDDQDQDQDQEGE